MLLNTRTYNVDRINPDAVQYAGPANTLTIKDTFEMKRTMPKPSGTSLGVARPMAKRVKTFTVGTTNVDAIVTLSASLPVGIAAADIDALLADLAAFAASSDAAGLFKTLDINA